MKNLTSNYTLLAADNGITLVCDGTFNIIIPATQTFTDMKVSIKNNGSGTITLTQYASKSLVAGAGCDLVLDGAKWVIIDTDENITGLPLAVASGGTGLTSLNIAGKFMYVDGARTDTYTENGSILYPYKKITTAIAAIKVLADIQIALGTQAAYDTTIYMINVAPGVYSDAVTISNMKYLGIILNGAEISGAINIATTQVGGPVTDDYSKVEFIGSPSSRAYRGRRALLSGVITMTRNNASLMYVNFTGVEISNNVQVGTSVADSNGSWVVGLQNAYFSQSSKYISHYSADPTSYIMLESFGYNVIKCKLAKQDNSAAVIELYNCNNTSFENDINVTPTQNCIIKNCTFTSSKAVSIVAAKTLFVDNNSYKQIVAATETLTGMTISLLDELQPAASAQNEMTLTGAISLTNYFTTFDTSAGGTTYTLANGTTVSQQKKLMLRIDGGDATVTSVFTGTNNTLTFADPGDFAILQWNGTDWIALELGNTLDMTKTPVLSTTA